MSEGLHVIQSARCVYVRIPQPPLQCNINILIIAALVNMVDATCISPAQYNFDNLYNMESHNVCLRLMIKADYIMHVHPIMVTNVIIVVGNSKSIYSW